MIKNMSVNIKICGITSFDALYAALKTHINYIGFVFHSISSRNLSLDLAAEFKEVIPDNIKKVAVVSNPSTQLLDNIYKRFSPQYIQLDDFSSSDTAMKIRQRYKCGIIKTTYVASEADLSAFDEWEGIADFLLFDSKNNIDSMFVEQGENKFDWSIMKKLHTNIPWILGGGITKHNVRKAIQISGASFINVSSDLEITPGIKSPKLIHEFVDLVHSIY